MADLWSVRTEWPIYLSRLRIKFFTFYHNTRERTINQSLYVNLMRQILGIAALEGRTSSELKSSSSVLGNLIVAKCPLLLVITIKLFYGKLQIQFLIVIVWFLLSVTLSCSAMSMLMIWWIMAYFSQKFIKSLDCNILYRYLHVSFQPFLQTIRIHLIRLP